MEKDFIFGRNSVKEALNAGRDIEYLMVSNGEKRGSILQIINLAKKNNVPVKEVDSRKLDAISDEKHQGVAAILSAHAYSSVDDILKVAEDKKEAPFVVIADGVEDPHNLGAIIRTAECAGVHGVIIPKRNSAGLSSAVAKTSAGALEYVKVARVTNISRLIDDLKNKGFWFYCADMDGKPYYDIDFDGAVALVIGGEGKGVSRLVKEKCDFTISLPLKGKITSLNASVAAGILMYQIARKR